MFALFRHSLDPNALLNEQEWTILAMCLTSTPCKKGEFLLRTGQKCTSIYLVEEGAFRLFYQQQNREVNSQFFLAGSFMTDVVALRSGLPSEYAIQTLESGRVTRVLSHDLFRLYQQLPPFETLGRRLLEIMVGDHQNQLSFYTRLTPEERYHYLVRERPDWVKRIPLFHLASYIGVSRETLSRIRARVR